MPYINPRRVALVALIGLVAFLPACQSASHGQATKPTSTMDAASTAAPAYFYVNPASVDYAKLFPAPPADGSLLSKGEIELMLAMRAEVGDKPKARAMSEDTFTPATFGEVLGPDFNPTRMPKTAKILKQAEKDSANISNAAKKNWNRKRPPLQDSRMQPWVGVPDSPSYPSGHATRAMLWANLLAAMSPDKKEALLARGRVVALDRVLAQVHFPTDVAAGMSLGADIAEHIKQSPAFQRDWEDAKSEWKR